MTSNRYPINSAKIGSQDGFRLPRAFSRDYPHLVAASGYIEVIDENTLIVKLNADRELEEDDEESLMMSLFLDTLIKNAIANPDSLVPYTKEMSAEIDELLTDVFVDE
jgi:antitoxin PrlF